MDNALRKFDDVIIASGRTPKLDYISNELKELYGNGFIEVEISESYVSSYSTFTIFNDISTKLCAKSSELHKAHYGGEAIALIRYKYNVRPQYEGMLIDMIINLGLCHDIYFITPRKKSTDYKNKTPNIPMIMVKYSTRVDGDKMCKELQFQMSYDYDPMSTSDNLILYLSNLSRKYNSILAALQGLTPDQKMELLKSITMTQYKYKISHTSNDILVKEEAFKRFFRDCCVYKPGSRLSQTDLYYSLSDYCNSLIPPIKLDEYMTEDIRLFVNMFELEFSYYRSSGGHDLIAIKDLDIDIDELNKFISD